MTCGSLRAEDAGTTVRLSGWVHRRRDLGGLIFIDLRDRFGLTQIVFNPEVTPETHELAGSLRNEFVISVSGTVRERPEGTQNAKLATGEVEIEGQELQILNSA